MGGVEEIVVLANSKKLGGRCVAGISTRTGRWVRPVSGLPHGKLLPGQCQVQGRQAALLDLVRFRRERQVAQPAQPENVLVSSDAWELCGEVAPGDAYRQLASHLVSGPVLLGNRGRAVPEDVAEGGVDASLAVVEPDSRPSFISAPPSAEGVTRRPLVAFELRRRRYELVLTDFIVGPLVRKRPEGRYTAADLGLPTSGRTLITVSLGEPFNGWHWKLAAAMLFLP